MVCAACARHVAFLLCSAAVICLAQTPADDSATFSAAVNLVTVPVVVRNARGEAVGTLRKEDFRLFDQGKLQTITKFSIDKADATSPLQAEPGGTDAHRDSRPGTSSAPAPLHFLAWVFDDVHMPLGELTQTRTAALRMLKERLDPETRTAILTTSGRVTLDFTGDRNKLAAAIRACSH